MAIQQSELASRLGVSASVVTRDKARGMPTHDVDAARAWRAKHVRQRVTVGRDAPPPAPPQADSIAAPIDVERISYDEARRRREAAEAQIAERKLDELNGSLVRVDDIRASLARRAATFREALMQIPNRLAAQLAAETDQARAHALLDHELRAALAHLTEA